MEEIRKYADKKFKKINKDIQELDNEINKLNSKIESHPFYAGNVEFDNTKEDGWVKSIVIILVVLIIEIIFFKIIGAI